MWHRQYWKSHRVKGHLLSRQENQKAKNTDVPPIGAEIPLREAMEEHRSMAIQATGPTDEETSPGAPQRSLASRASELNIHRDAHDLTVVEPVRSFGVQASVPDSVEVPCVGDGDEPGVEQQRSFAVQVHGTQRFGASFNTR